MAFIKYRVGDVVRMKKKHPCGGEYMSIKRIGTDFLIHCEECGHNMMIARPKFEKAAKELVSRLPDQDTNE